MKPIKIKINGRQIITSPGKTIRQAARENGIDIPGLCDHDDFPAKANCRICLVELAGGQAGSRPAKLVTSCSTPVADGLDIKTDSERVKKERDLNIELIFAEHIEKCPTCVRRFNCKLLELADKYKIEITRFRDRKAKRPLYKFANAVEIDGTQCIDCRNCLDACSLLQKINYLSLKGKNINQEVVPAGRSGLTLGRGKKKLDCIYCGQCAVHCPVNAAAEQSQWHLVERVLKNKNKVVVAQFAPSVRVSLGEEFGRVGGEVVSGRLVAALKALGFNYVFDVNFGADITTMVEAEELIKRFKPGGVRPLFTSCCPAWVKYLEFYRPDLIPNLTTARSPQMHSAGMIKTFWAEKLKLKPKDIIVVSIMPCTAKKFEAIRPELKINGLAPIDYVLTTRELAWLIKKNKINFSRLKSAPADNPLAEFSGAAAIYGASGGVMESALRTAGYLLETARETVCLDAKKFKGKTDCRGRLEFKPVRGAAGVKRAELELSGKIVRVAVVNGIGNIAPVLENLKAYDYVEVMACPDGCVGGGGQPIPTGPAERQKRLKALYKLDAKSKVRRAHENKEALDALRWLDGKGKLKSQVLHTKYKRKK